MSKVHHIRRSDRTPLVSYSLPSQGTVKLASTGKSNAPMQVVSARNMPVVASQRVIYDPSAAP